MTAVSDETGREREYGTDRIDKLSERKLTCRELARYIWDRATRVPMCFEQDIARLIENERREAVRRSASVAPRFNYAPVQEYADKHRLNYNELCSVVRQSVVHAAPVAQEPESDPTSDERWQAGLDYAMEQFCHVLRVDPKDVNWDAATEELEDDVRAVIGNILRVKFGDDFDPMKPLPPAGVGADEAETIRRCANAALLAIGRYKFAQEQAHSAGDEGGAYTTSGSFFSTDENLPDFIANAILALLSRAGDQSNSTREA